MCFDSIKMMNKEQAKTKVYCFRNRFLCLHWQSNKEVNLLQEIFVQYNKFSSIVTPFRFYLCVCIWPKGKTRETYSVIFD